MFKKSVLFSKSFFYSALSTTLEMSTKVFPTKLLLLSLALIGCLISTTNQNQVYTDHFILKVQLEFKLLDILKMIFVFLTKPQFKLSSDWLFDFNSQSELSIHWSFHSKGSTWIQTSRHFNKCFCLSNKAVLWLAFWFQQPIRIKYTLIISF